jgi:hypothetical protein
MKKIKYNAPQTKILALQTYNGLQAGSEGIGVSGDDATQPQRGKINIWDEDEMEEEEGVIY